MAAHQQEKPAFRAPEQKPFKAADTKPPLASPAPSPLAPAENDGWKPMATAPEAAEAKFLVRATVNGKGVNGTETLVRYRMSRKMVGRKWQSALTIIDDRLGTKLGFRPTEWKEAEKTNA